MFGATEYTCAVDMWSIGTILVELLLGHLPFQGQDSTQQHLIEIMKLLGTPSDKVQVTRSVGRSASRPTVTIHLASCAFVHMHMYVHMHMLYMWICNCIYMCAPCVWAGRTPNGRSPGRGAPIPLTLTLTLLPLGAGVAYDAGHLFGRRAAQAEGLPVGACLSCGHAPSSH